MLSGGCRGEGDIVAEGLELADEVSALAARVEVAGVEVGAAVSVTGGRVVHEVPNGSHERSNEPTAVTSREQPAVVADVCEGGHSTASGTGQDVDGAGGQDFVLGQTRRAYTLTPSICLKPAYTML